MTIVTQGDIKEIIDDLERLQLVDLTWQEAKEARMIINKAIETLKEYLHERKQLGNPRYQGLGGWF